MPTGLPISRLIRVMISLAAAGAQILNINSLLIMGDSDVIDTGTRIKSYASLADVATDFGTTAAEYYAASLYFAQSPQPTQLYIGRWARTATSGRLFGQALTSAEQAIANFTAVTSGGFKIQIDGAGSSTNVASINLSAVTTLNGVATAINTALATATIAATCSWDGSKFIFKSTATGTTSKVLPLTAPAAGTNLAVLLKATSAYTVREVDGIAAETAVAAVTILDTLPTYWYGLAFACATFPDNAALTAVAAYIEAAGLPHLFGHTVQDTTAIDPNSSADLGSALMALAYKRTWLQYSTSSAYAAISAFGRLITVDFTANKSMISLMYKTEPGVVAEALTSPQAAALDAKRYNYYAGYDNGKYIFEAGTCCGDAYIDEIFGADWLKLRIQSDVFNAFYTNPTKIDQTDQGNNDILTVIESSLDAGVNNGLLAPGTWTSGGFGQLATGDFLPKGYYTYAPPVSTQTTGDRGARKSVSFQVAAKFAGAINTSDIAVIINR